MNQEKPYHHPDLRSALVAEGLSKLETVGSDLSLRALAKAVGVSPAAPYRHFTDRSKLMGAIAAEGFHRFSASLASAGLNHEPIPALKSLGMAYLKFAFDHPSLYKLMFSQYGYSLENPECQKSAGLALDALIGTIARAHESGWKPGQNVMPLAMSYWAALHGWAGITGDGLLPPGSQEPTWTEILDAYIY
jgi:AcrR family transcriptional regulator